MGTFIGGLIGGIFYSWNKVYLPIYMGISTIIAVPMICVFFRFEYIGQPWYMWVYMISFIIITCFFLNVNGSNIRAILININFPETRSSVISIAQLLNNLGQTLGPIAFNFFLGYII